MVAMMAVTTRSSINVKAPKRARCPSVKAPLVFLIINTTKSANRNPKNFAKNQARTHTPLSAAQNCRVQQKTRFETEAGFCKVDVDLTEVCGETALRRPTGCHRGPPSRSSSAPERP